ncbi:hypothetical protein vBAbaMD22_50 [Acinetobacter phage vB_AbaM_D22]|nr:hypothetical protein vBAbaMD22_50 [Acinetobacter phage vB_AbaM_D22]
MIVIKDKYGSYLSKIWTAKPEYLESSGKNHVLNTLFHHDISKAMTFDNEREANLLIPLIVDEIEAGVSTLKQAIYHKGDGRYLKSVSVEQAYSKGRLVAKSVSKWTLRIEEALQFTDFDSMNALLALTERGENQNGNYGQLVTKYV